MSYFQWVEEIPTSKDYYFLTLEDEFGFINIMVRQEVYTQFRQPCASYPLLVIGEVQQLGIRWQERFSTS